jgi:DNA-directed RNA polymerase specialized sigma24 family protein
MYVCSVDLANIELNFEKYTIIYIFIKNSLQLIENEIEKNYNSWRKTIQNATKNKDRADSLLHQLLLVILERRDKFQPMVDRGELSTYVVYVLLKQSKGKAERLHSMDLLPVHEADDEVDMARLIDYEYVDMMTRRLNQLDQQLIRARAMGIGYEEIENVTGISNLAARLRVSRAIKKLNKQLSNK